MPSEDWIVVRTGLSRRREVVAIAAQAGRSRHEVLGLLVDFWGWMDAESGDGRLIFARGAGLWAGRSDQQLLEGLANTIGGDEAFWRAVTDAGWLALTPEGVEVPNFDRWLGRRARERLLANERQARYRGKLPEPGDEGQPRPASKARSKAATDPRFARAWAAYPRKQNKAAAEKAWDRAGVNDDMASLILVAIARQLANDDGWRRGFVPHFSTWLNNRRWEDEPHTGAAGRVPSRVDAPAGKYDGIGIKIGGAPGPADGSAPSLFPE